MSNQEKPNPLPKDNETFKGFGVRHVQALLMFICLTFGYGIRVIMGIAIVAMTDEKSDSSVPVFPWNKEIKDIILSSFFWGYMVMQIPGGYIAHRYGAKPLLAIGMFVNGIVSISTPYIAKTVGWQAICACRVIQGLSQGTLIPSLHTLLGKWSPVNERSRMCSYVYGGSQFGTLLILPIAGYIAFSSYGWPAIFYSSGLACLFAGGLWLWIGAESPEHHKTITQEEKDLILPLMEYKTRKPPKTPWVKILTHLPMFAIAVGHIGGSWVQIVFITELPSYLSHVMGVNIKTNGFLSALPQLSMWICGFITSFIADYLIKKQIFSITIIRKLFNSIAMWGASICLLGISFLSSENIVLVEILMILALGLKSGINAGYHINHIDISPNFAGTMIGFSNCISNGVALMVPLAATYFVKDENDPTQWRNVFFLAAGFAFVTNLIYIIFGSAKKAHWNDPEQLPEKNIELSPMIIKGQNKKNEIMVP